MSRPVWPRAAEQDSPDPVAESEAKDERVLFANIPNEIAERSDLSGRALVLFGIINALEQAAYGKCIASNENLAKRLGISISAVRHLLLELQDAKLIARSMDHGRRQKIRVTWKPTIDGISARRRRPEGATRRPEGAEETVEEISLLPVPVRREKRQTTSASGKAPREPGCDDDLNSSFVSSRFPSKKELEDDPEHERCREACIDKVIALGLRVSKQDYRYMTKEMAAIAVDAAAKRSPGGLKWVARAIDVAGDRRDLKNGKLPAQMWTYVLGTLRNWEKGESSPPEGYPGEEEQRVSTRPIVDSVTNARL